MGSALGSLIAIKESKDKGLADMETGSEVYMSEPTLVVILKYYSVRPYEILTKSFEHIPTGYARVIHVAC